MARLTFALLMTAPLLTAAASAQQAAPPAWPGDAQPQRQSSGGWPGDPGRPAQPQQPAPQQQQQLQQPMMPSMPGASLGAPPPQQQEPPCVKDFVVLRTDVQKKAEAIQAASKRKATPAEACPLFNNFVAAEIKMLKFAQANARSCGIPQEAIEQLTKNNKQSTEVRLRVCDAAAQMKNRPAGPSLGDALGTRAVPDASNVKKGGGTFDTLTGTPLGGAR